MILASRCFSDQRPSSVLFHIFFLRREDSSPPPFFLVARPPPTQLDSLLFAFFQSFFSSLHRSFCYVRWAFTHLFRFFFFLYSIAVPRFEFRETLPFFLFFPNQSAPLLPSLAPLSQRALWCKSLSAFFHRSAFPRDDLFVLHRGSSRSHTWSPPFTVVFFQLLIFSVEGAAFFSVTPSRLSPRHLGFPVAGMTRLDSFLFLHGKVCRTTLEPDARRFLLFPPAPFKPLRARLLAAE